MDGIWANLLSGFKEIAASPFRDLSIWWLLAPIIMFWLILEIYFGRYKKESLGWNTALGNGLSMFWIVVISLKTLFSEGLELFSLDKLLFVIFIGLYSMFIIFISFTHKLKERIFFLFSSPTIIYYLSAIAVLWLHDLLAINFWVAIDLVILYIIILVFETFLKKVIPPAESMGAMDTGIGGMKSEDKGIGDIGRGIGKI
ncbi:hypothetical protein KY347_05195 [Candidatus Woesearchaeota archaeon]|nr:hypothetical protein [Candidatus Woesearchaeota archaeon]